MSYSTLSLHGPYLTITRQPYDRDETPRFAVVDVRKIQDIRVRDKSFVATL